LVSGFTATCLDMWIADKLLFVGGIGLFLDSSSNCYNYNAYKWTDEQHCSSCIVVANNGSLGATTELDPILLMAQLHLLQVMDL